LHFVVSEGGVDKDNNWREVNFFDTKKLRKKWQYHVITALKKAVKGTDYEEEWYNKLGSMFKQYPSGFDCDCMPEEGPVERLVVYLCKYVSAPPISIRRIEKYDGQNVTYRYKDHRKGEVHETIPATEFIGRMIQHLPPKGFRMVRYYGIYARPVRNKIHEMVALVLKELARTAEKVARYFACLRAPHRQAQKRGISPEEYRRKLDERFGKRQMRCEKCGSTKMLLIRIWSKEAGMIYEIGKDDPTEVAASGSSVSVSQSRLPGQNSEQLVFAF